MDDTPEQSARPSRRHRVLLVAAICVSTAFAFWQMWVYLRATSQTPPPPLARKVLVDPPANSRDHAVFEAILPISDPPPLAIPPRAEPQGAWILNRVQNGRVDLQWTYDTEIEQEELFTYFANQLTAEGFRRLGSRRGKFIGPTEVWRKNENIISISLRTQGKNPKIRLIIRQIREVTPADYQRRFPTH